MITLTVITLIGFHCISGECIVTYVDCMTQQKNIAAQRCDKLLLLFKKIKKIGKCGKFESLLIRNYVVTFFALHTIKMMLKFLLFISITQVFFGQSYSAKECKSLITEKENYLQWANHLPILLQKDKKGKNFDPS